MRIHYTGRNAELTEREQKKLQREFDTVNRVLVRRSDLESNVILSRQRHLREAEVTLRALRHTLVVTNAAIDPFTAMQGALDKLEKQTVRDKHKIIDTHRPGRQRDRPSRVVAESINDFTEEVSRNTPPEAPDAKPKIVRSNGVAPEPMTAESAALHLGKSGRDHVSFRDVDTGQVNVLLRRRDGSLELVEAG